jgi:hypothetical protein
LASCRSGRVNAQSGSVKEKLVAFVKYCCDLGYMQFRMSGLLTVFPAATCDENCLEPLVNREKNRGFYVRMAQSANFCPFFAKLAHEQGISRDFAKRPSQPRISSLWRAI